MPGNVHTNQVGSMLTAPCRWQAHNMHRQCTWRVELQTTRVTAPVPTFRTPAQGCSCEGLTVLAIFMLSATRRQPPCGSAARASRECGRRCGARSPATAAGQPTAAGTARPGAQPADRSLVACYAQQHLLCHAPTWH